LLNVQLWPGASQLPSARGEVSMRRSLRDNGLSIVVFALFFAFLFGQSVAGYFDYNSTEKEHGRPSVGYTEYLRSGDFIEAVFENWESEFLQMGLYVVLTVFLYQKGSAESKDPEAEEPVDADPREESRRRPDAPWPVRRGGLALKFYENSLSLTFIALFLFSFAMHAIGGANAYSQEQIEHGGAPVSVVEYVGTSRFWFESLQNWQSEFVAVGALAVLSIYLRQKGSSQSKPVAHPHGETGG
jgi:hypothetical protein